MSIKSIFGEQKNIQNYILRFLNDIIKEEVFFEKFDNQFIQKNKLEFELTLHLISKISDNHYRFPNLIGKIESILLHYQKYILANFSNSEIFHIFQNNKRILLFLLKTNIISINDQIMNIMQKKSYLGFFVPEIKEFLSLNSNEKFLKKFSFLFKTPKISCNSIDPFNLKDFESNREIDENESFICKLIRNDSINEFIIFINKTNFPLSSKIESSIFETNPFLIKNKPTLIEYSAFFGSIQIFKYLFNNKIQLNQSLWLFAIHGKNAEIIHFLEDNEIKPTEKALYESIKCHHLEITEYLCNNYFDDDSKCLMASMKFFNFDYLSKKDDFENNSSFYYFCKYDYIYIVDILSKSIEINVNFVNSILRIWYFYIIMKILFASNFNVQ